MQGNPTSVTFRGSLNMDVILMGRGDKCVGCLWHDNAGNVARVDKGSVIVAQLLLNHF